MTTEIDPMKKSRQLIFFGLAVLIISGCSAVPVESRYGQVVAKDTVSVPQITEVKKDTATPKPFSFDFSPHRTWPEVKQAPAEIAKRNPDYWYTLNDDSVRSVHQAYKIAGFRILLHTTDLYPEADSVRTAVYLRTNKKAVYIDFESPFYKVKVGDYQFQRQAEELNFQLNQLGFRNTLVISDSVYVY